MASVLCWQEGEGVDLLCWQEGEGVESPVGRAEQQQVEDCEEGNTWLLNSIIGSNRSLSISKVNLTHPIRTTPWSVAKTIPVPSTSTMGVTLRSADRSSRYHMTRQ
uniref:Uncharacterized protein n=1 Tax=Timema cristinae TaxID=61476 RepID=A0A7R9CCL0_TIMCR|nr:unnamed protein product [Timema cristinae]